jgi:hypothetical protein
MPFVHANLSSEFRFESLYELNVTDSGKEDSLQAHTKFPAFYLFIYLFISIKPVVNQWVIISLKVLDIFSLWKYFLYGQIKKNERKSN